MICIRCVSWCVLFLKEDSGCNAVLEVGCFRGAWLLQCFLIVMIAIMISILGRSLITCRGVILIFASSCTTVLCGSLGGWRQTDGTASSDARFCSCCTTNETICEPRRHSEADRVDEGIWTGRIGCTKKVGNKEERERDRKRVTGSKDDERLARKRS